MAQMFRSAFKSLFRPFEQNRKCFHSNYYYLDDPNQSQGLPSVDLESPIEVGGELHHPVHVEDFSKHVAQLHADGDIGFSKEYELIQNESIVDEQSSEHSQHSDNKAKNRYLNIIACKWKNELFQLFIVDTCALADFTALARRCLRKNFWAILNSEKCLKLNEKFSKKKTLEW